MQGCLQSMCGNSEPRERGQKGRKGEYEPNTNQIMDAK